MFRYKYQNTQIHIYRFAVGYTIAVTFALIKGESGLHAIRYATLFAVTITLLLYFFIDRRKHKNIKD